MSERLSAEERADKLLGWTLEHGYIIRASSTGHKGFGSIRLRECLIQTIKDAEQAAVEVEREPITDKSICSRGHPRACVVPITVEYRDGTLEDAKECTVCTQLEAELKPLREALELFPRPNPNESWESYGERAIAWRKSNREEALRQKRSG